MRPFFVLLSGREERKKAPLSCENDALRILNYKNELLTLRYTAEEQCDVHA